MVQVIKEITASTERVDGKYPLIKELAGLSTDSKPTDCATGSSFVEVNTGKLFLFNSVSSTWTEVQ